MNPRLARALVRAVIGLIEWSPRMTLLQKCAHVDELTAALRELELDAEKAAAR